MVSYVKNFTAKLLLLPLLALLGALFLLVFLLAPQFKLFRDKSKVRPWSFTKGGKDGYTEKEVSDW